MTDRPGLHALRRHRSFLPFLLMLASLPLAPLSLRAVNDWMGMSGTNVSYVPSFESRRGRKQFRTGPIEVLRAAQPKWVFIGDSMLGTRIDARLLSESSGGSVTMLMRAASGPAWWYLTFKNHLVASGVKPRATFFFFRDTNLTDTMFRFQSQLGDGIDEVAREREPELDAIVAARRRGNWWRIDRALNGAYDVETAYTWMHATVRRWYALWRYPDPQQRMRFEQLIEDEFNNNFRPELATDLTDTDQDIDFHRDLPTSVLPLIMELATQNDLRVCFVRVQRRPSGNVPPPQSPALQRYVRDFRAWADSQGACFHDDYGDPGQGEDLYEDGDHVLDRARYTRLFRSRLDPLFR